MFPEGNYVLLVFNFPSSAKSVSRPHCWCQNGVKNDHPLRICHLNRNDVLFYRKKLSEIRLTPITLCLSFDRVTTL